jgi:hypothetical protein
MPDPLAFFSHIPKAAGSTLLEIIRSQYRRAELLQLYDREAGALESLVTNLAPRVRMIAGHNTFHLRTRLPRPCHIITVLRDPVELVISLFYYIQRSPTHFLHGKIHSGEMDLRGLAERERNRQLAWITGEPITTTLPDDELLARAKATLMATGVTFGMAECFDESVAFFSQALGWQVRAYSPQNVTRDRPKRAQLNPGDLAAIEETCATDIALFRFAREHFEQRIQAQPPSFAEELARLRNPSVMASALAAISRRLSFSLV